MEPQALGNLGWEHSCWPLSVGRGLLPERDAYSLKIGLSGLLPPEHANTCGGPGGGGKGTGLNVYGLRGENKFWELTFYL